MVTMNKVDQMFREAEQGQEAELEQLQDAEGFAIQGVELNAASRMTTIYHRETGEPRQLPRLAAEIAIRKRYRDRTSPLYGRFIFAASPTKTYYSGKEKCLLHPDNERRHEFDTWGLPVCTSDKLASPGEVRNHMRLRHTSANRTMHEHDQLQREQDNLESNRALAESVRDAMLLLATGKVPVAETAAAAVEPVTIGTPEAPLYVSQATKRPKLKRRRVPKSGERR